MRDDLETDVVEARKTLHEDDVKGMEKRRQKSLKLLKKL